MGCGASSAPAQVADSSGQNGQASIKSDAIPAGVDKPALAQASKMISLGDLIPHVEVFVGHPPEKVDLFKRIAGKKVIVVGLPGAFTPT